MLSEIKKSNQIEPAEKQEVEALKNEVKDLKSQISFMSKNMEQLAALVGSMIKNQEERQKQSNRFVQGSPSKKRRMSVSLPNQQMSVSKEVPPSPVKSIQPLSVTSLPDASTANDSDFYTVPEIPLPPASPFMTKDFSKDSSMGSLVGSLSDYDEDLLSTLLNLDDDSENLIDESKTETEVPDTTMSSPPSKSINEEQVDTKLVEQLRHSLNNLPKKLQELFVERLVNAIASPESFQKQVEAVTVLAHAAAQEAKTRTNDTNMGQCDLDRNGSNANQSVELATAALGSFLARYGANLNTQN
jgi:hypothetical protein